MRTDSSLRNGLEPRFEALPKNGKSPNPSGGVMAEAITPHPQLVITICSSDSFAAFDLPIIKVVMTKG